MLLGDRGIALRAAVDEPVVDFERDVLPILEHHCLDCHHGEDAQSALRLDTPLGVLRGGDSGEPTILPGQSSSSSLILRVTSDDSQQRMPPDGERLSASEVSILAAWVDYVPRWDALKLELTSRPPEHWSFRPLTHPSTPEVNSQSFPVETPLDHPIDRFLAVPLAGKGLSFSPQAPRSQLIRRLFLVVLGFPPTPEQTAELLADQRPDAWERLVDRVLASPHYGERAATYWLDLVHFGQTNGFETNRERPHAWRYRDYVVRSFNDDKPYAQFVQEQIAGDALGADTATGFLVAGPNDIVKGQDALLSLVQRQDELADMINTTGTALLGLTLGCARCHNHKFDPVTQSDYYALQGIFAGVQHGDRPLPQPLEHKEEIASLSKAIQSLESRLEKFKSPYSRSEAAGEKPPRPLRTAVNPRMNVEEFPPQLAKYVRMTVLATNQGEPCVDEFEVYSEGANIALASPTVHVSSSGDFTHPFHKLEHINDGRYGNPRSWIAQERTGVWVQLEFVRPQTIQRVVWGRDRDGQYADRLPTSYRIESSLDGVHWTNLANESDREPYDGKEAKPVYFFDSYPQEQAALGRSLLAELGMLGERMRTLSEPPMVYAGSFSAPGPVYRLYRGDPLAPREEVAPGGIASLGSPKLDVQTTDQQRRLALAQWITNPRNPLTMRVIANRIWQHHFGTGIVETASDFGTNGTPPSHPELLDYLATELLAANGSLKHLHRMILTSKAWRQESRPTAEGLAQDRDSRFLWRFPPRRLEAEAIRDSMLLVSGRLDLSLEGPGFSPFEVELENVRHYFPKAAYGPTDWRRMLYMMKVRQEKDSVFGLFDCPDFNQVVPRRGRSTTPLQALNLLNSRFVLQQADFFAEELAAVAETAEERIKDAFQRCFLRPPDAVELQESLRFVEESGWPQFARALLNSNEFVFLQ